MDYKEAIKIIESNFPPSGYNMLQEALVFAINEMNRANSPTNPKMYHVIINGAPTVDTCNRYMNSGWIILGIDIARRFYPNASETDIIMFMAKPIDKN